MTNQSPKLGLPYIQPSQAQKHVTHNEAIQALDTIVQLQVLQFDADTPPAAPDPGQCYGLSATPTGDWAGQGGRLAAWDGSAWTFVTPLEGWVAWETASGTLRVHSGGAWIEAISQNDQFPQLGIATTADTTNRLAVASEAVLLSHAGGSHRLKVNKAAPAETASLLFQSNWTGHAEMGLAGDTAFSLKVSDDGAAWTDVMRADPSAMQVDVPVTGNAVQSAPTDTTPGRLMRADYGYCPGNLVGTVSETNGTPTGSAIESGQNGDGQYVRFADGTQICWNENFQTVSGGPATWTFPIPFYVPDRSPAVTGVCRYTGGPRVIAVNLDGAGSYSASVYSWNTTGSDNVSPFVSLTAIGRWY